MKRGSCIRQGPAWWLNAGPSHSPSRLLSFSHVHTCPRGQSRVCELGRASMRCGGLNMSTTHGLAPWPRACSFDFAAQGLISATARSLVSRTADAELGGRLIRNAAQGILCTAPSQVDDHKYLGRDEHAQHLRATNGRKFPALPYESAEGLCQGAAAAKRRLRRFRSTGP